MQECCKHQAKRMFSWFSKKEINKTKKMRRAIRMKKAVQLLPHTIVAVAVTAAAAGCEMSKFYRCHGFSFRFERMLWLRCIERTAQWGLSSIAHIKRFAALFFLTRHSLSRSKFFSTLFFTRWWECVCVLLFQFLFLRFNSVETICLVLFFLHSHATPFGRKNYCIQFRCNAFHNREIHIHV